MSKKTVLTGIIVGVLALAAAGFFMNNSALSQGIKAGEWTQDYDAAIKFAQNEKLPVLLNFTGSDWCVWCKLMQRNVFTQSEWKQYAKDQVVLVTLDFPQNKSLVTPENAARNNRLQQQFGVQGYPTYIILDSDGKTVLGKLGAGRDKTAADFIAEMEDVLKCGRTGTAGRWRFLPTQKTQWGCSAPPCVATIPPSFLNIVICWTQCGRGAPTPAIISQFPLVKPS